MQQVINATMVGSFALLTVMAVQGKFPGRRTRMVMGALLLPLAGYSMGRIIFTALGVQ